MLISKTPREVLEISMSKFLLACLKAKVTLNFYSAYNFSMAVPQMVACPSPEKVSIS